jgi:hypothetical protein
MLLVTMLLAVFVLPFVGVGICFAARRLGDESAMYYLALVAVLWFGAAGAALLLAPR